MPANENSHVKRLHRFLPFSSAHDQIYEEYQTQEDRLDLETVAIKYTAMATRHGARCVVLTGDAGHGKTHMCRRILGEELQQHPPTEAHRLLLDACDGLHLIDAATPDGPKLRIHKDLSEIHPPSAAATLLEDVLSRSDSTLIVCANEGRLRAIVNSETAGEACREISALLKLSFTKGLTATHDAAFHIVNLNYQSVAATHGGARAGLLRRVLKEWVGNGNRWRACGSCDHQRHCPIQINRSLLATQERLAEQRQRRFEELFEVVERLGHVVTIREMLMTVAYAITGGLTCSDVAARVTRGTDRLGWQHAWAFYNLLFAAPPNLTAEQTERGIPILSALRRLDPGRIAVRQVDENILNHGGVFDPGQPDLMFPGAAGARSNLIDASEGIDDFSGNPQNKAEVLEEERVTARAVAALRRRAFFDAVASQDSVMRQLGFKHGDMFLRLLRGQPTPIERVQFKNTLIAGLHCIQGLRVGNSTVLHLVDPAFGKASADAAIIARSISNSSLNLIPANKAWTEGANSAEHFLPNSVDWIDRSVILRVDERLGVFRDLPLDLLSFECVARAASGYVSEEFYANEMRRVRTFLGQLAESVDSDIGQIAVFVNGQIQHVSLDQGVIQVGGN